MKRGLIVLFLFLILFPTLFASSVDDEIQKITYYAEEYETGNIDYIQLLIHLSSVRGNLNEILGATDRQEGGLLKQEKIKEVLGEPNEQTNWVWVEREDRETRVEEYVPIWRKVVFDGKKIQIRLSAYPSLFKKGEELVLIYRLNPEIEFKKPKDELDIKTKIDEIQSIAEIFNSDPSDENAEELAKKSVNAERAFDSFLRQSEGNCEDFMKSLFGAENKRETMHTLSYEINFYQGENFDARLNLEMCDDCEWNWINFNFWIEGRGPGFKPIKEERSQKESSEQFMSLDSEGFKSQTTELISNIKTSLETGNYQQAFSYKNKLWAVTEAWNQKSNDVWKELDLLFKSKTEAMSEEERNEFYANYGWIKEEQEKRQKAKELRLKNYGERKQFYLDLLSGYEKREFYFTQEEYEKRLVEEFKISGEEICDNNQDDNGNEQIDCSEAQCGGKFCGKGTALVNDTNGTIEKEIDLYCISSTCQAKEESIEESFEPFCGNHICEIGEETCASSATTCANNSECNSTADCGAVYCPGDCSSCQEYPALECIGRVIFSGVDENGCNLAPVCIEEDESCETDSDCAQPLCGTSTCVEDKCTLTELAECSEAECVDGAERTIHCNSGEDLVSSLCSNGLWVETGISCEGSATENEEVIEERVRGACNVREDCGGEDDVCSNGKCVTIPKTAQVAEEEEPVGESPSTENPEEKGSTGIESIEGEQKEISGEQSNEAPQTGNFIFNFFASLAGRITGYSEEGGEGSEPTVESTPGSEGGGEGENSGVQESPQDNYNQENKEETQSENTEENYNEQSNDEDRERQEQEDDERREEEGERREKDCTERCGRECYDMEIRPCVESCIFEECGNDFECDAEEATKKCDEKCKGEKNIEECSTTCQDKCMKGEDTWKEPEREERKEEKGVFSVGGGCRTSQGKTNGFIWFGGWGDPFEKIQPLKNTYYSGGEADWCKWDLDNLKKQRQEFEKGFNQQFAEWFFEKYLANSAEDWEQHVSGIFELYWKDVDISREMANRMNCLEISELPEHNLINVKYESEYGKIEFWEEIKTAKLPGTDEETTLISPYMKIWVFPPKEFFMYEMKNAMKNHELPGPSEEKVDKKNTGGELTEQEKQALREDGGFMETIATLSDKYNGNANVVVQFKNQETSEVVFNLYVQLNKEDIMKLEPMLPEEVPKQDILIEMDVAKLYELVEFEEQNMRGAQLESPPWDKQGFKPTQIISEVTNGAQMYLKFRSLISSAKVTPDSDEGDAKSILKPLFMNLMGGGEDKGPEGEKTENQEGETAKEPWEDKEVITGEVIVQ